LNKPAKDTNTHKTTSQAGTVPGAESRQLGLQPSWSSGKNGHRPRQSAHFQIKIGRATHFMSEILNARPALSNSKFEGLNRRHRIARLRSPHYPIVRLTGRGSPYRGANTPITSSIIARAARGDRPGWRRETLLNMFPQNPVSHRPQGGARRLNLAQYVNAIGPSATMRSTTAHLAGNSGQPA
jgi:hypothetical protein